jgi:hypothetical protein
MGVGANPPGANQNPGNPAGRLAGGDRGLWLSMQAIRRQLAAMPHSLFLVRLIHQATRRPFPGERLWTATQLLSPATVRFLRIRNREGCDVYIGPTQRTKTPATFWSIWIGLRQTFFRAFRATSMCRSRS